MIEPSATEVVARDEEGQEHRIRMATHPGPLISIADDDMTRILATAAARELCWQLLRIIAHRQPATAKPLKAAS